MAVRQFEIEAAAPPASSAGLLHSRKRTRMHILIRVRVTIAFLVWLVFAGAPRDLAIAHEGHQMECKKTSMQAIKADIQAMNDGEAKRVAVKEMKMAEEMMDKKAMDACRTHMHNAMDAMDK